MQQTEQTTGLPAEGLVKLEKVMDFTSLSKTSIYKEVREGKFPGPVKVGGASLWRVDELREWLMSLGK